MCVFQGSSCGGKEGAHLRSRELVLRELVLREAMEEEEGAGWQPGWHTCFPRDLGQPQRRARGCTHSEREGNKGGTHAFPEIRASLKGEPPAAHTASGRATRVAHMLSQRSGPASRESPRLHTQRAGGRPGWHTCFPIDLG